MNAGHSGPPTIQKDNSMKYARSIAAIAALVLVLACVPHDDGGSPIGGLDKALDEAEVRGWTVVSMKNDWRTIFPQID
jgi:hypothetical protein